MGLNDPTSVPRLSTDPGPLPGKLHIDTVVGPMRVVPECKVQALCTNGWRCWEAGRCLRCESEADDG